MKRKIFSLLFILTSTLSFAQKQPAILFPLIETSEVTPQSWKYTLTEPLADVEWFSYDFVPTSDWVDGRGVFGKMGDKNVNTAWQTPGWILLRKTFTAGSLTEDELKNLTLKIYNDDWVTVYINGTIAYQTISGWENGYAEKPVDPLAGLSIKTNSNQNVLAIACFQDAGGQHIDAGLYAYKPALAIINTSDFTTEATLEMWDYTTTSPASNWFATNFIKTNDWLSGAAGFGGLRFPDRGTSVTNTIWGDTDNSDIWLRKTFTCPILTAEQLTNLKLKLFYDDNVEVYINGVKAFSAEGYLSGYSFKDITPAAKAALVQGGVNTIAVKDHQGVGGQYIDCGLYTTLAGATATPKLKDAKLKIVAANGLLTVEGNEISKIDIYDVCGKLVKSVIKSNAADISSLESGVYLTSVSSEGKTSVAKFIIK